MKMEPTKFTELPFKGYARRTQYTAGEASDFTIAFATDFNTAGEKLTAKIAGKKYCAINIRDTHVNAAKQIVHAMRRVRKEVDILNIAGNGIYTFGMPTQESLNWHLISVFKILEKTLPMCKIISGGQTGVDWAALVAASYLGIPCEGFFPKGFMQRDITGRDFLQTEKNLRVSLAADLRKFK